MLSVEKKSLSDDHAHNSIARFDVTFVELWPTKNIVSQKVDFKVYHRFKTRYYYHN